MLLANTLPSSEAVDKSLSDAERELLGIYTRQAYDAYLSEKLSECEYRVAQIEALNRGDIHARFLTGAIVGRKVRPGTSMSEAQEAIRIWRPLVEQMREDGLEAMKAAIAEALSTILYIPVEQAARQWDVYCDVRTARELETTIRAVLALEETARQQDNAYGQWIAGLIRNNYVFLVDEIIGMNKPIPIGREVEAVMAYGDALAEAARMAERIPDTGSSEHAVRARALQKLSDFRKLNQTEEESAV